MDNYTTKELTTEVAILGAGPGGYSAAFRLADLGKKVVLIERFTNLGGVCLNVGCIPSKALLHAAKVIDDAKAMTLHGVNFADPQIDIAKIRLWKDSVITKLTGGLKMLAKKRQVEIITGTGRFISPHQIEVTANDEQVKTIVNFGQAIIAAGSMPTKLPFIPEDPRIMDSTAALQLQDIPAELLIIGGGIIGLEMATIYNAFGSKITIVEFLKQLITSADADIVKPLHQTIAKKYAKIMLETKVTKVEPKADGLWVTFEDQNAVSSQQRFDKILVSVGRKPNGKLIGAENAGIITDDQGFVAVNNEMRTNISHIFALGDIVGNPMLAHKAIFEGHLTAEIIAGSERKRENLVIPSVAYTDPEIAIVGFTESEALKQNINYDKAVFPWLASGRSLSMGRSEGLTKLLFDKNTKQLIGASIVGSNAGELISELALAITMKATAEDIIATIHPHPTLSETTMLAAEVFAGTVTDLLPRGL